MIKINYFKKIQKNYLKIIISFFMIAFFLSLTGCAGMNSSFGCNARAGDSCTPVSKVNKNAEAGDYDNVESGSDSSAAQSNTQTFGYTNQNAGYNVTTPIPGEPIRFGETVQRVWIAPYQDASQNYHEPSYIYTVLNQPHWIGLPAKEVSDNSNGD